MAALSPAAPTLPMELIAKNGYVLVANASLQSVAADPVLLDLVSEGWALYPDHVVFLGEEPIIMNTVDEIAPADPPRHNGRKASVVIVKGVGFFLHESFGQNEIEQLCCYGEVLLGQKDNALNPLPRNEIRSLLKWEAEGYRLQVSSTQLRDDLPQHAPVLYPADR